MKQLFKKIFDLQLDWTSDNSPPMQERGKVVRNTLPAALSLYSATLSVAAGPHVSDLKFEGRDGVGRKTTIPWVRFYSSSRSPSAQNGWYCVYLFHPDGTGVYLALAHGSTSFVNGSFVRRDPHQIATLVNWARNVLGDSSDNITGILQKIDLGNSSTKLDRAYEASTVLAKWYSAGDLPLNDQLIADATSFAKMLGRIYAEEDKGRTPGQKSPEVEQVEQEIAAVVWPLKVKARQGMGLTAIERKAVEMHSMEATRQILIGEGYSVSDVSGSESFDFKASIDGRDIFVEVKGTTGGLGSIILTANEVDLHLREAPLNALFVLHSINLDKSVDPPIATGGLMHRVQPWHIDNSKLNPLAFYYDLFAS